MLKKWLPRLLLGLIFLFTLLLITAPAKLLENQLTSSVPGLRVQGTTGRSLSGQFRQLQYQSILLEQVSWDLALSSLLTGNLGANIQVNDALFSGSFFIEQDFSGHTLISNINATQSMEALVDLNAALQFLTPFGHVNWTDVSLGFDQKNFNQAQGNIQWKNARITVSGEAFTLGSIRLDLSIENNQLVLNLSSDPTLDLQGIIKLNRNGGYQLDMSIKEELPANIYNTIRLMARPDGNGRLEFSLKGILRR